MSTNSDRTPDSEKQLLAKVIELFSHSLVRNYANHTERVLLYCKEIGAAEHADLSILSAAALVHDIGMTADSSFTGHIKQTMLLAEPLLRSAGYTDAVAARILTIASQHHPAPGTNLSDLESRILFDADNMDIVGVYGTLRWFGDSGKDLPEAVTSANAFLAMYRANIDARASLFHTPYARQIGDKAAEWTANYCRRISAYEQTLAKTGPHFPLLNS